MLECVTLCFALSSAFVFADTTPTYSKEVVRIFQQKCQSCHHTGGLAPFPLVDFADMKHQIKAIDRTVQNRSMPPWKAATGCNDYASDRSMSQADIDTVHKWVAGGAPEGNRADLPPPLTFNSDWTLGTPDLAVKSDKPYVLDATGDDVYRCFILPYQMAKDDYIVGLEIKPDKASVVHHGIVYMDTTGESLNLPDPNDPQPGYTCFGTAGFDSAVMVGGWTPGSVPEFLPKGIGIFAPKGARFVLQIHYHRDGQKESDQTQLGLHFAKDKITSPLASDSVYDMKNLYIPAGKADYTISAETTLDKDVKIVNVLPHMHLLGKKIGIEAILPDNTRQCLIQIDDWDFDWQGYYTFKNLISLPKGTRIRLTGMYDNSENNPNQFNHPPKDVKWGDRTVDEMFIGFFSFITN